MGNIFCCIKVEIVFTVIKVFCGSFMLKSNERGEAKNVLNKQETICLEY